MPQPQQFDVVIERDSDGFYVAPVPQLHGCHTQARSLDEVMRRIREAIELCVEVEGGPGYTWVRRHPAHHGCLLPHEPGSACDRG